MTDTQYEPAIADQTVLEQAGIIWDANGVIFNLTKATGGGSFVVRAALADVPAIPLWRDLEPSMQRLFAAQSVHWQPAIVNSALYVLKIAGIS